MNDAIAAPVRHEAVLDSYCRVQRTAEELVAAVRQDQFDDPTPCTEWTVRDLLNHLVFVDLLYAAHINREELPEREDRLGGDHAVAFRHAGSLALTAFSRPGALDEGYTSPFGELRGSVIVQHVVNELLVHSWDLARATGQPTNIEPELAEESLAIWQAWIGGLPRGGEGFGPEQPVPDDASAADRLAAYLGRSVN